MSFFPSLHDVLDKDNWNLEDIKTFLELHSSSIKADESSGDSPLIGLLKNKKCSIDAVKLLLNYGSDVNCRDSSEHTPLLVALTHKRNMDYIKLLLEKGADIKIAVCGASFICHAFVHYTSIDVIRLLLDAGCPHNPCVLEFGSVLHCAIQHLSVNTVEEDVVKGVLQLLIERRVKVNAVESFGYSVLCSALGWGIQANIIKVLLVAGGKLKCRIHKNSFICATIVGTQLKYDVVQLLLEQGAWVDIEVLQRAVKWCSCEARVIELMLDYLEGADIRAVEMGTYNTLLHLAVGNRYRPNPVVELLVKRGVKVNKANGNGDTALHEVVKRDDFPLCVVKTLLKSGSQVNVGDVFGRTALHLAMKGFQNADALKMLLAAGARFGVTGYSLLKGAIEKCEFLRQDLEGYRKFKKNRQCYKMLLKCYFLENPDFDFRNLIPIHSGYNKLWRFGSDCMQELQKLNSMTVDQGRTLREFLSGRFPFQVDAANCEIPVESVLFNRLLRFIAENAFPLYLDIISAKVGRSTMNIKLKELQVYTYKSDESHTEKKIVLLNYDIVYKISHLITDDDDLLRFILAFNKTPDHSFSGKVSKENIHEDKRSGEHSEQCCKHPRLDL